MGRFSFAQNEYHGWSQIHADEDELLIKIVGMNENTHEHFDMHTIRILNDPSRKQK